MKINWGTVVSVVVAMLIIGVVTSYFTKKQINPNTGEIETSFSGFSG